MGYLVSGQGNSKFPVKVGKKLGNLILRFLQASIMRVVGNDGLL